MNRIPLISVAMLLLLIGCMSTSVSQTAIDTSAVGTWMGAIQTGPTSKLRIIFHVIATSGKALSCTLDSPDQGAAGIPGDGVTVHGDSVFFAFAMIQGMYAGKFSAGKNSIEGTWNQGPASIPLLLERTSATIELKRPQLPKPPFPYRSEDVAYDNAAQGVKLAGTITLPNSPGPFPLALLITGSGPQDRDETLMGHKPFLVLADYLTRRGIAVLRVDDRGVGQSTGSMEHATTADFATDVRAGISYAKSRIDIDPKKIGLIGHSEGGIIAPMVASESNDVAFIVMLAGSGVPGFKIIDQQLGLIEKANGVPEEKISSDLAMSSKLHAIVMSQADSSTKAKQLHDELVSAAPGGGAGQEEQIRGQIQTLLSPWFVYFLSYDPATALEKVRCPVLALDGDLDLQVSAADNIPAIAAALKKGGNKDVTTRILPGLNHLFQHAKTGSPSEYGQIEETFAPEALKIIGDWVTAKVVR